ncbi:hypothetical protein J5N97_024222 [Dioscorea zingiberensis]|uniref:Peptidase A1 domain-containing protein n=1 Tax=Dioscorea zingiberensis TaxID=325984 RepID=A0A9D5H8M0_9LILI|nr:hypothetical protein J5N97_024222 [Dioscorea zingiberensis]
MMNIFFIFILLSILSNSKLVSSSTKHTGFAVKLIHRYSPRSPFYDPNVSAVDRWKAMHRHSELRVDYFRTIMKWKSLSSSSSVSLEAARSPVIPVTAVSYLMMFKLGDPPVDVWASIDTGSGMLWIQCLPCLECYHQAAPVFDPKKSTTYRDEPCNTDSCKRFPEYNCSSRNVCKYETRYGDGSMSIGDVSRESISFLTTDTKNSTVTIQDLLFGCAHENWGQYEEEEQGIVGMSMSKNSLISQIGGAVKGRFSTCFVDIDDEHSGSQMLFGDMAVLAGDPTPLAVSSNDTTWYYINLDDISVGKERLNLPPRLFHRDSSGNGGMILDTVSSSSLVIRFSCFVVYVPQLV